MPTGELNLEGVTWQGPPFESSPNLSALPHPLANLLEQINGFILWEGALHVRGLCTHPDWHSLHIASEIFRQYDAVEEGDVVFAQDCVGDQFVYRHSGIYRLLAETGDIEHLADDLTEFLRAATTHPMTVLGLHPLLQLREQSQQLQPGQLIMAYPPFCTEQAAAGVSLKPVASHEVIHFHLALASNVHDGDQFHVEIVD